MYASFSASGATGGNGAKAYQCIACGNMITHSDRLLSLGGKTRYLFVNPEGVECDFYIFSSCPGAVMFGEASEAHTWFPGYGWRMAFCRNCGQHLGWRYEAASASTRPFAFWGILVSHIISRGSPCRETII